MPSSPVQQIGRENQEGVDQELLGVFFEALLPEADGVGQFLESLVQSFGGIPDASYGIVSIECRAYQRYPVSDFGGLVPTQGGTLIINCMTPSQESEASFNRWYKEEHLPMLSAVPGWRSSRRFVLVDSRHLSSGEHMSAPKYLALHEWVNDGIFEMKEYKAAVNTPWRTEVISAVQEKYRWVLQYVGKLEESMDWE
jgi:hypothetical protein